jgi:hypothetical protein
VIDPRLLFAISTAAGFLAIGISWKCGLFRLPEETKSNIALWLAGMAIMLEIFRIGLQVRGYI